VENYHVYAVLIQHIKYLLLQSTNTICYTFKEGNQYADFLANSKLLLMVALLFMSRPLPVSPIFLEAAPLVLS